MKTCFRIFSAAILITAFAVSQANAALLPSYYTDRAAWQADVAGLSVSTFNGEAPDGLNTYNSPWTYNFVVYTTTDPNLLLQVQTDDYQDGPEYQGLNSGDLMFGYTDVTITPDKTFTSFGVDIRGLILGDGATSTFTFSLSNGHSFDVTVTNPTATTDAIPFVGFSSLESFSWVTIKNSNEGSFVMLDNVSFAATVLPEPTSIAVFGIGGLLAHFGIARRKNRKA